MSDSQLGCTSLTDSIFPCVCTVMYKTNRLHFFRACVYCNRSRMTLQRVKNKKSVTGDEVEWRDCCPLWLWCLLWHLLQYTHKGKWNLFLYILKFKGFIERFLEPGKRKTSPLPWYDVDLTSAVRVSLNRSRSTNQWKCTQKSRFRIIYNDSSSTHVNCLFVK